MGGAKLNDNTTMNNLRFCKDKIFSLPRQERRIFNLLAYGKPRSVADISKDLGMSDPRSVIRCLRKRGYHISDMWVKSKYGNRFKRYFIRKTPNICNKKILQIKNRYMTFYRL